MCMNTALAANTLGGQSYQRWRELCSHYGIFVVLGKLVRDSLSFGGYG